MPIGYMIAVGIAAAGMLLPLVPLRRSGRLGKLSWFVSAVPNESPFAARAMRASAALPRRRANQRKRKRNPAA